MIVQFRGDNHSVVIDHNDGYDPSTNTHEIEWHFEYLSPEEHNDLEITDEEEQSIHEQLVALSHEMEDDDV